VIGANFGMVTSQTCPNTELRTPNTEVGRAAGFIALKASGGMQKQADAAKKVKNHYVVRSTAVAGSFSGV